MLFSGGINYDLSESPDVWAVTNGELYTPGIDWAEDRYTLDDGWTTVPRANVVRNYHSVALLLPDGRVFTAGSNLDGQSEARGRASTGSRCTARPTWRRSLPGPRSSRRRRAWPTESSSR